MSTATEEAVLEAVFTVCAEPAWLSAALPALETVTGAVFAGEFQEYLTSSRKPQFPGLLKQAAVCVALIDCDRDPEAALETMERLQTHLPGHLRLVAVASTVDATFLMRAMRAGCNELLRKPFSAEEFSAALRRFQNAGLADLDVHADGGKAVSFLGVKGGVGTTTLAVHVATHLVRKHKKKVLLVDLKQQLGHVALYLGIRDAKYYFSELLRNADRLDAHLLEGLVTHHPSGLDVIASPDICAAPHKGSPDEMERVISFLKQRYQYVLLDVDTEFTEWMSPIIAACDEVALVCTPDVAALRDMARHVDHLGLTDGFANKLRIVVNRSSSEAAVSSEQIEEAVRFPVSASIPNNYAQLVNAINLGEPVGPQTRGNFTQAIGKWTQRLANLSEAARADAPVAKKRFSLWG